MPGVPPSKGARGPRGAPSLPPRPSLSPAAVRRRSARLVVAFVWLAIQAVLVSTAGRRSDGAFGFRMFNESSVMQLSLYREVVRPDGARGRVHVDAGVWSAHDEGGALHRFSWYDRVPGPVWIFDREMPASYGIAAQLTRLRAALEDVGAHLDGDAETHRLVLVVTYRRNGREPQIEELSTSERLSSTEVR